LRIALILIVSISLSGCSLFTKKKSFEDSDTYRELMKNQKETDKKLDSLANKELLKSIDSLNKRNDSLAIEIEKSMKKIRESQKELDKQNSPDKVK